MRGRNPTAAEKKWLTAVCGIGCIVCRNEMGITDSEVSPHHTDGTTKPDAHFKAIPLCDCHHQKPCPTGTWATRHGPGRRTGKYEFEKAYGTEEDLLEQCKEILEWLN